METILEMYPTIESSSECYSEMNFVIDDETHEPTTTVKLYHSTNMKSAFKSKGIKLLFRFIVVALIGITVFGVYSVVHDSTPAIRSGHDSTSNRSNIPRDARSPAKENTTNRQRATMSLPKDLGTSEHNVASPEENESTTRSPHAFESEAQHQDTNLHDDEPWSRDHYIPSAEGAKALLSITSSVLGYAGTPLPPFRADAVEMTGANRESLQGVSNEFIHVRQTADPTQEELLSIIKDFWKKRFQACSPRAA